MDREEFNQHFGSTVRQRRVTAGLTQEEVATRLGMSRTSIVNIEQGRQGIPLSSLPKFAAVLGCEPARLLPREATEPSVTYRIGEPDASDRAFLAEITSETARENG